MIDTDETGQKKLERILELEDCTDWTEFEEGFVRSLRHKQYASLTPKQKSIVATLFDKAIES